MKTIISVVGIVFLIASVSSSAGGWTNWEDYQAYRNAKTAASEASDAGDHSNAVAKYKEAAELAAKSATKEIKAWQLNNAGYALITKFKASTVYQEKIDKLSALEPGKEKIAFQQEIAIIFNDNMTLLHEAKTHLEEAKELVTKEEGTVAGEAADGPLEKIQSNLEYIEWVINFTQGNLSEEDKKLE
jgi:hypothetical protein